jgi:hypothetical protein
MNITQTNRPIWVDLFQAAIEFRDLAPWQWMDESDIIGVEDPETGQIGWCSIMGSLGEFISLTVYLGDEGFRSYERILELDDFFEPADMLRAAFETKALRVEFTDREAVSPEDRKAYKALDLRFRGRNQWIQVRDVQPGYFPWYLSDKQAVFLTHCLRQAMEVSLRCRAGDPEGAFDDPELIPVRAPQKTEAGLVWQDMHYPDPKWEPETRTVDPMLIFQAKKDLPYSDKPLCFMFDYLPHPIEAGEKEDRPYFARMATWIDPKSGMILATELFTPKSYLSDFNQQFMYVLHAIKAIPRKWILNSELAYDALEPIAEALDLELTVDPEEPIFSEVQDSFNQFFG